MQRNGLNTELVKGTTIEQALKLTENDIIRAFDGLPENKKHFSNLGIKALRNAIDNYFEKGIYKEK